MAGGDKDKVNLRLASFDQLAQVLPTDQLTVTLLRLEQQEVTFILMLIVVFSDRGESVLKPMA